MQFLLLTSSLFPSQQIETFPSPQKKLSLLTSAPAYTPTSMHVGYCTCKQFMCAV